MFLPPRRRARRWLLVVGSALVGALAVAGWGLQRGDVSLEVLGVQIARPDGWAPRSTDRSDEPLGSPEPVAEPSDAYAFLALQDDGTRPIAYDPCRALHVVVREAGAPPGGRAMVLDAFARLSRATGLQVVDDGATTEAPSDDRALHQPDRYGERWAPVLVAWSTPEEDPGLDGDVLGRAGSVGVGLAGGDAVYVTGAVVLDGPQMTEMLHAPDGATTARAGILHELGHLVGLDHLDAPGQLMHPQLLPGSVDYAAGDLTGLAELGRGACVPAV